MCYMSNNDSNLLSLKIVFRYFKVQPRFHARIQRHILNPPLWPSLQVTKLPTTFFVWRGGGVGEASDPEFPLLFQENPASRTFIYRFPESRFLFLKNIH